jgi:hypothetical protein
MHEDDWAVVNRRMCNFIHRGIVPAGVADLDPERHALAEQAA